jgi:hypothetical protein
MLSVIILIVVMLSVMTIGGSTVVEQAAHDPKVEGSNPATAGSGKEKLEGKNIYVLKCFNVAFLRSSPMSRLTVQGSLIKRECIIQ